MPSSDLWVAGSVPNAKETGKSSSVTYAIGAVQGALLIVLIAYIVRSPSHPQVLYSSPILTSQVTSSTIKPLVSYTPAYRLDYLKLRLIVQVTPDQTNQQGLGLIGLGPNKGSNVFSAVGSSAGAAVVDRIFRQNTSTPNFLSVLLGRYDDPTDTFPGDITVGDILQGYDNISSQSKLDVTQGAFSTFERFILLTLLQYLRSNPAHSIGKLW